MQNRLWVCVAPSFGTGADICTGCRRTLIFGQTCNHWCNHCKDLPPLTLLAKELKELQSRQSPPDHCIGATSSVSQLAVQLLHGSKVYVGRVVFRPISFRLCFFCRCGFVIVVIFPGRGVDGVGNNVSAGAGVDRG